MPVRDLIYDVGMNNGDDTAYYLSLGFRTVAIEANPELVEQAKSRFAREISAGRLFILNIGIADREGQLPFWICDTISRFSSFNREFAAWDNSAHHQIQVPCSRFKTILDKFGVPYFCKIDIQGSEPFCLEDLEPHNVPTFISVEVSNLRELEMLGALGYSLFKCISQSTLLPVQLPAVPEQKGIERAMSLLHSSKFRHRVFRKLGGRRWLQHQLNRTRRRDGWFFTYDSSGAFGDQTLGRWLTYDEMFQTYREFRRRHDAGEKSVFWFTEPYVFWSDFHAQYVGSGSLNDFR
jgi:FkbM family methyltransferase